MEEIREFLAGFVALIITIIFISLFLYGVYSLSKLECEAKAKVLGYKCNFAILQGCALIKPDGKVILLEQLREFND